MAAEAGVDSAIAQLTLSADELRTFRQLFRQADTDNVGVVTGDVAVPFFERTRLDSRMLGEIWRIADKENRGFLTFAGFSIVLRLISHAQAGRPPTPELALQQAPVPRFDGFTPAPSAPSAPLTASHTGSPAIAPQHTGGPVLAPQLTGGPNRFPVLTPERVAQYTTLFERQSLPNGLLPGEQAKQLFVKSGLPGELLHKIWQLADTEQRGSMVLTEFIIAMHLLSSLKSGALRQLPNILPAALYEAATRQGSTARQSPSSTGSGAPMSAIPRQLSGSGAQPRAGSPLGRPPIIPQNTGMMAPPGGDWLVTPPDKARFDQIYDDLDKERKGFIAGDEAVGFMRQSNLPEGTLATIWDLSDINADGCLNKDEFAVAMYLIRQQRSQPQGSVPLTTTLPPALIPPSMRAAVRPQTANSVFDGPQHQTGVPAAPATPAAPAAPAALAPSFHIPQPPPPKSAIHDLFGLDAASPTSATPAAPLQVPLSTGGSSGQDPFSGSVAALRTGSPPRPSPTTTSFKPFVPSSSFGRGLTSHTTGDSASNKPAISSIAEDLLGDTDPEVSKKFTNDTTELANLSNQVGSLSKQMQEVQGQRNTTQNDLNQTNLQKKNFEQRLAQLRAMYEKEAADTRALTEQLNNVRNDTKKLQSECLGLEGKYRDIQQEHQHVVAALQADQQENASLRERIRVAGSEIAQLKGQVERLRSEARQQKGLVAINKKQLSTSEGEKDRLKAESEELYKPVVEDINRTSSPASVHGHHGQVASPAGSTGGANNPFFRRAGSADIPGAFASPSSKPFEDVFGPSFDRAGSTGTPPPPTSFTHQHTGASSTSVGSAAFATPPTTHVHPMRQATSPPELPPTISEGVPPVPNFFTSPFPDIVDRTKSNGTLGAGSDKLAATPSSGSRAPSPVATRSIGETAPGPGPGPGPTPAPAPAPAPAPSSSSFPAASAEGPSATTAEPEAFGATDSNKAKADFDNAFASFTKSKKSQDSLTSAEPTKSIATFNTEFPPITELELDDDSDSSSDRGGFDDDFAPVSPPTKNKDQLNEAGQNLQMSPGTTIQKPSTPVSSNVVDPFGVATPNNPAGPTQTKASTSFDDFDGLEDAREGSMSDDFATISRSGLDDFNPVFDSSPSHSQAKSDGHGFGTDSSFDFATISSRSAHTAGSNNGAAPASGPTSKAAADNHDWDAIFADLDSPSQPGASTTATPADDNTTGQAVSDEPEGDDPLVKNLTHMGYARSDAVTALEKHDYNLEKAANYLASQS